MPASPAGRSARSRTTRSARSSHACHWPSTTRSACRPQPSSRRTCVLVFDHLTHTLSAVASLHAEAPEFEGRYRIAEAAIFEALERTDAAVGAELGPGGTPAGAGADAVAGGVPHRPDRVEPRARRPVHPGGRGGQGRDRRRRGDPGRSRPAPVVRPPAIRRPARPARCGSACYRRLRRVNPSPYLFFVRTPQFEVVGASRSSSCRSRATASTTHPIAGTRPRGADAREDALLAEQLQRDPKERAEHVMLVDLGRNDLGRVAAPEP